MNWAAVGYGVDESVDDGILRGGWECDGCATDGTGKAGDSCIRDTLMRKEFRHNLNI